MARLREIYKKEIVPALTKQFGYKSVMQVPRVSKIVLNMGVDEAVGDKKLLENAAADMTKISGQSRSSLGAHGSDVQDSQRVPGRLHGDATWDVCTNSSIDS